jgi:hypothetical protein
MDEVVQLDEVNDLLEKGQSPSAITERAFLGWFNAYRRGWHVVQQINEWLDYYNIEIYPYFDSVYIDSLIEFRRKMPARFFGLLRCRRHLHDRR